MLNKIDEKLREMLSGEGGDSPAPADIIEGTKLELDGTASSNNTKVIASITKATAGVKSYKFEYKLSTEDEYTLGEEIESTELTCEYTYTSLTAGKENNLKITVTDNKRNTADTTINVTPVNKWNNNNVIEETVGEEKVPVPDGAHIVDPVDSIDKGVVIEDSKQNQWVWVPVDEATYNSMFVESETPIALSGSTGVTTTRYSKSGIIEEIGRTTPGDTSNFREPDLVTSRDNYANAQTAGFTNLNDMATKLVSEYNTMADSIKKYGGFYIGRYELSAVGVKAGYSPTVNTTWYNLYKQCKELTVDTTKGMVRMIWRMPVGRKL